MVLSQFVTGRIPGIIGIFIPLFMAPSINLK
jgi:hypothetical protein